MDHRRLSPKMKPRTRCHHFRLRPGARWGWLVARHLRAVTACALTGFVGAGGTWANPATEPPAATRGVPVQLTHVLHVAHDATIPYALFVPTGYDPAKPAPLVVLLHGLYSNPWQVIHYQGITQEAEKRGYLVVAPFGYNATGWYGSRGPGKDFGLGLKQPPDAPENLGELSEQDVLDVLTLVQKDYAVDPRRTYLMGHSMGGGGTLYLGMKYPERWAALAALAPAIYGNPDALAAIRQMPVMVVQGDQDRLVHVENTRRWVAKMQDLHMDHRYVEIAGGDHIFSICANAAMIGEVFDFFDHHAK